MVKSKTLKTYVVEMVDIETGRVVCLVNKLSKEDAEKKRKEMEQKIYDNPIGDYYARIRKE